MLYAVFSTKLGDPSARAFEVLLIGSKSVSLSKGTRVLSVECF